MVGRVSTARKVARVVKTIVKGVLAAVLVAVLALSNLMLPSYSRQATQFFGYKHSWDNSGVDAEGLDLDYNKADYESVDDLKAAAEELDKQIAAEGYVLLQNEDASLPLPEGTTISFFSESIKNLTTTQSIASVMLGSSSDASGIASAFGEHGLKVNQELLDFYTSGPGKDYAMGVGSTFTPDKLSAGSAEDFSINECPLSVLEESGVLDSAEGTTPVFVLRRVAGEGRDMPRSMYNHADNPVDQAKTYLEPDTTELEILQYLNDNFDNTVLVVNTASALDLDFLEDMPNIRSVIFMPSAGTYGLDSLAGIMAGDINPSARTADTFSGEPLRSPAAQNFGDYQYVDENGELTKYNYVTYAEGIYVGYRYYETRYEDAVMGTGNAGDFSYADEVTHPFGFGLSYTTFEWADFSTVWDGDECIATVTVTNTGGVAGKDVVELYVQSPYTDYDRANGVEKASVELVGLGKTELLEPGESQTVEISFNEGQLKAYDANGAGTYVLDAGTYYVTAGRDAHDAVNNVLAAKGYTTADGMTADGDPAMVSEYVPDNADVDVTTYAADSYTGEKIENRFEDVAGDASYLTRSDWEGTFPEHDGTPLEGAVSTWGNEINGEIDGEAASLLYVKEASPELVAQLDSFESGNPVDPATLDDELVYGADNGLELIDLRGRDYDDPMWDDLLDQLTPEDYDVTIARGGYGTEALESVGKPFTIDVDTAAGLLYGANGLSFCTPVTVAQTWNTTIYEDYGEMIGNDAAMGTVNGWYAPSMNIHRTPFTGRNGEYYSEDGFLSGMVGSLEVKGAASKGVYSMIKHFALNDQEDHRGDIAGEYSIATWANEQSIRELYLEPFEMCMKVGDVDLNYLEDNGDGTYSNATRQIRACQGVMTAFNRIGATWTGGSYPLLSEVVRGEWGFDGFIITDYAGTGVFMDAGQMIEAGGDSKLVPMDQSDTMWSFDETSVADYHYGREALHHLLYVVANSNAMDGVMHGSVYKPGIQTYDIMMTTINVVCVAGLALIGFTGWRNHVKRKAERAQA